MSLLILLIVAVMSIAGCLQPVSLDEFGYVISIGIDRGESKRYCFTFMLQRELSESGTENEGGAIILSAEGDCLDDAVNAMEGNVPYTLSFSRANFFIFSRETASSDDLRDFFEISLDSLKIRPSAVIAVCEGEVSRFIGGLSSNNDANVTKLQTAVMLDAEKTGMVAIMSASRLFEATASGCFDYCAAYGKYDGEVITDMEQKKAEGEGKDPVAEAESGSRIGGLKSFMDGAAVFSGWRMTASLDREETMFLNIANGDFKNGALTLPAGKDGGLVTMLLSKRGVTRRVEIASDGTPHAYVEIKLAAGFHKKPNGVGAEELSRWLDTEAARYIENRLNDVFLKCRDNGSDAMRFGTAAVKLFRSGEEWEKYGWKNRYRSLEAEFRVSIMNVDSTISGDLG